jgi:hypothetical protein
VKPWIERLVGTSRPRPARPGPQGAVFICTVHPEASSSDRSLARPYPQPHEQREHPSSRPRSARRAEDPARSRTTAPSGAGDARRSRLLGPLPHEGSPRECQRLERLGPAADPLREKRICAAARGAFHHKTILWDRWETLPALDMAGATASCLLSRPFRPQFCQVWTRLTFPRLGRIHLSSFDCSMWRGALF